MRKGKRAKNSSPYGNCPATLKKKRVPFIRYALFSYWSLCAQAWKSASGLVLQFPKYKSTFGVNHILAFIESILTAFFCKEKEADKGWFLKMGTIQFFT